MEEGNFNKPLKPKLTPLQEKRLYEEKFSISTDRGVEAYETYLALDYKSMKGQLVLDIGSGRHKRFAKEASQLGIEVVSLSPHYRDGNLKVRDGDWNEDFDGYIDRSVSGRAQELPFKDDTFDCEVAFWSLPYYLSPENLKEECKLFLTEIIRTLKPGKEARIAPIFSYEVGPYGMNVMPIFSEILEELVGQASFRFENIANSLYEFRLIITKKG